jgi:Tfp pilus assembly protein PilX
MPMRDRRNERGAALVLAILVLSILTVIGTR